MRSLFVWAGWVLRLRLGASLGRKGSLPLAFAQDDGVLKEKRDFCRGL